MTFVSFIDIFLQSPGLSSSLRFFLTLKESSLWTCLASCFLLLRFREVMQVNEPEVQEVSGLFRSLLLEVLDQLKEEQEAQRLARQWNQKPATSMSLMNFRSRIKINPFGSTAGLTSTLASGSAMSDLKTVSEDVERGVDVKERAQRVWSTPDFRYKRTSSSEAVWRDRSRRSRCTGRAPVKTEFRYPPGAFSLTPQGLVWFLGGLKRSRKWLHVTVTYCNQVINMKRKMKPTSSWIPPSLCKVTGNGGVFI